MPFLDVSDLLTDPDLADRFTVMRRQETVDDNGNIGTTRKEFRGILGVVTASSPNDLDRQADYQTMTRSISVVTKFPVQGIVTGFQPDIIVWRGTQHLVKHVSPYPQFGRGFYQVECSSMSNTDAPA